MIIDPRDIVDLAEFPLLWRWTQTTHATLAPDALASIRPIRPDRAATVCEQVVRVPLVPARPDDRLVVTKQTDRQLVSQWLERRVREEEIDVILVWDQQTAALVGRGLFIDRWDDFWYPSSDDLSVLGADGRWRIEMHHDGTFEFCERGAVEQGVGPDDRSPSAPLAG
jgi:hypothetical protein